MTSKVTLAREIAFDTFIEVMEHKKKPEDVLEQAYKTSPHLSRVDRALIKEIVFGSLRWYSKIYWILQNTSSRNLDTLSPQTRAALVLGTYQIFYMDRVPDRAAVNESVEYVRKKSQASAVSFINGILRQIARRAEYFTKPDKKNQAADYLALQFAHPKWLVERWLKRFKFEKMEVMLAANNQPPPFFVRVNSFKTPHTHIQDFQHALLKAEHIHSERQSLRGCLILKKSPDLGPNSLFSQGFYTVQDQASQLIPIIVAPKPGELILDAAAGPGGKLGHMYELAEGQAKFLAVEKNPLQMTRAQETLTRLGHTSGIEWVSSDFLTYTPPQKVDKVLIDAPCTGLGVLRRHPEGKWHKDLSGIAAMAEQQRQFITHGLRALKPGGELIYSVCSFEPEETEDQLNWVKTKYGAYLEEISLVSRLPDYFKRYVTRDNMLMIFAGNQDDMDGFGAFAVRLKSPIPE